MIKNKWTHKKGIEGFRPKLAVMDLFRSCSEPKMFEICCRMVLMAFRLFVRRKSVVFHHFVPFVVQLLWPLVRQSNRLYYVLHCTPTYLEVCW